MLPENALTKKLYNGINVVSLWVSAEVRGLTRPIWATYSQWAELGAQVRKGDKSSLVIFYKEYETEPEPENADDHGKRRVARASLSSSTPLGRWLHAAGAAAAARTGRAHRGCRSIHHRHWRQDRAWWRACLLSTVDRSHPDAGRRSFLRHRHDDPLRELFRRPSARADALDGARSIAAIATSASASARPPVAAEELVAEIGAAFLCAELGITQDVRADHAQYLANWLQLLKRDTEPSSPPPPRRRRPLPI